MKPVPAASQHCPTCGLSDTKRVDRARHWECSHVDCPHRRQVSTVDHTAPVTCYVGVVGQDVARCSGLRVTPTTRD